MKSNLMKNSKFIVIALLAGICIACGQMKKEQKTSDESPAACTAETANLQIGRAHV